MPQGLKTRKLQYIDIQDGEIVRGKPYRGGNGKKYTWNYQNTRYMIKSQERNQKVFLTIEVNKQSSLTYNNSILSEYLSSNQDELCDHFYDMFVIDTFLLNWDRNHTNWGFTLQWDNNILNNIKIAPLIDFGSSLFAKQDETKFNKITQDDFKSQVDYLILNSKSFYLDENDEKIVYHDFLKTTNDTTLLKKFDEFLNNERLKNVNELIGSLNLPINLIRGYQYLISRSQELIKGSLLQNEYYQKLINDNKKELFKKHKQNSFSR